MFSYGVFYGEFLGDLEDVALVFYMLKDEKCCFYPDKLGGVDVVLCGPPPQPTHPPSHEVVGTPCLGMCGVFLGGWMIV